AAALIPDKSSLFINIGTTTEEVAMALRSHSGLRVITNNLNVAMTLYPHPSIEVIVVGGPVRRSDGAVIGGGAVDIIRQFKVDTAVIGASALDEAKAGSAGADRAYVANPYLRDRPARFRSAT